MGSCFHSSLRATLAAALLLISHGWAQADPIHDAARSGEIDQVSNLLNSGTAIESPSPLGPPLHIAVRFGEAGVTELLLNRGADPNSETALGTPLITAVRKDSAEIARMLLEAGADPNLGKRAVAIVEAAKRGNLELIELLLEFGADPDAAADSDRVLSLHEAARRGYPAIVSALLEGGANPNAFTARRETAYHLALHYGQQLPAELLRAVTNPVLDTSISEAAIVSADAELGRDLFNVHCGASCHSAGEAVVGSGKGPHIWKLEGKTVGTADPNFGYVGLADRTEVWDHELLDLYMFSWGSVFPGVKKLTYPVWTPEDRAHIIAFLRTLPDR